MVPEAVTWRQKERKGPSQDEISAFVTSGTRTQHNTDSLHCAAHRGGRDGCVLMTIPRQRWKCALRCSLKLLYQEEDLCYGERAGTILSSHQSNPVDENPRTFKPFIVPSSGGVDTICYNNQGIMIYTRKKKSLALTDYGCSHSEL